MSTVSTNYISGNDLAILPYRVQQAFPAHVGKIAEKSFQNVCFQPSLATASKHLKLLNKLPIVFMDELHKSLANKLLCFRFQVVEKSKVSLDLVFACLFQPALKNSISLKKNYTEVLLSKINEDKICEKAFLTQEQCPTLYLSSRIETSPQLSTLEKVLSVEKYANLKYEASANLGQKYLFGFNKPPVVMSGSGGGDDPLKNLLQSLQDTMLSCDPPPYHPYDHIDFEELNVMLSKLKSLKDSVLRIREQIEELESRTSFSLNNTILPDEVCDNTPNYFSCLPPEIMQIIIDEIDEISETAQERYETLSSLSQTNRSFKSLMEQEIKQAKKDFLEKKESILNKEIKDLKEEIVIECKRLRVNGLNMSQKRLINSILEYLRTESANKNIKNYWPIIGNFNEYVKNYSFNLENFDEFFEREKPRSIPKPPLIKKIINFVKAIFKYIVKQVVQLYSECQSNLVSFFQQALRGLNLMNLRI